MKYIGTRYAHMGSMNHSPVLLYSIEHDMFHKELRESIILTVKIR